jgi:hypothetical protein
MSINVKKYTKDQMAKMVEDAQEKSTALEKEVVELKDCMNGEAINKANEIANLKADLDSAKNSAQCLNDQGQQYWRVWQASKREVADLKNKLNDTEAALGRANALCAQFQSNLTLASEACYNAEQRADYAESHPWRNLRALLKRKLKMA